MSNSYRSQLIKVRGLSPPPHRWIVVRAESEFPVITTAYDLRLTTYFYMYQSSTRTNFSDILLDPMAIAILGSIALHATLGAGLPLFTQPEKDLKKADAGTVKVVELTPGELQRIPQAPPNPAPQALPPVTKPITPSRPLVTPPPRTPQISTNSQGIPFSPIRIPLEKIAPQPADKKVRTATPQPQPTAPIFDPNLSFKPSPKPSKPPIAKGIKPPAQPKPTTKTPPSTQPPTQAPPQNPGTDNDGSEPSPITPPSTASSQGQQPTQKPSSSAPATPANQASDPLKESGSGYYGAQTQAANAKLQEYLKKYPNLKQYPPQQLPLQNYKSDIGCPKVKQPPFIVLMVAFDKIPEGQDNNILGDTTSPLLNNNEKPYIDGDRATLENTKLMNIATSAGFAAATEADKSRPESDKGRPVLYQYRVPIRCIP